jgi:ADP-ribosyl-[dinitrogen reductase] hydrolase
MRLAPVVMFFHPDRGRAVHWAAQSSRTTHGALECVEACRLLAAILHAALAGAGKEEVLFGHGLTDIKVPAVRLIAEGAYRVKPE